MINKTIASKVKDKVELYNDMLIDNKRAFEEFHLFDYYECCYFERKLNVENLAYDINNKILDNAKLYMDQVLGIKTDDRNGNCYPRHTIYLSKNIRVNLKEKTVYSLIDLNIKDYEKDIKEQEKELHDIKLMLSEESEFNKWFEKHYSTSNFIMSLIYGVRKNFISKEKFIKEHKSLIDFQLVRMNMKRECITTFQEYIGRLKQEKDLLKDTVDKLVDIGYKFCEV